MASAADGGRGAVASSIRRGVSVADILKKFDQKKHLHIGHHRLQQQQQQQSRLQQNSPSSPSSAAAVPGKSSLKAPSVNFALPGMPRPPPLPMPQPVTGATGKLPAPPPPPSLTPPLLRPPMPLPEDESESEQGGKLDDQQYENESSVRPFDAQHQNQPRHSAPHSGGKNDTDQQQREQLRRQAAAAAAAPESRAPSRMSSVAASGRYRRQSTRGNPHRYSKRHRSADTSRRDRKPVEDLKSRRRSQSSLDDLRTDADDLIVNNNHHRRRNSSRSAVSGDNAPPLRNSSRNNNGDVKKPAPPPPSLPSPPRPKSALRQNKSVAGAEPFSINFDIITVGHGKKRKRRKAKTRLWTRSKGLLFLWTVVGLVLWVIAYLILRLFRVV